jgi:hypothetical protein
MTNVYLPSESQRKLIQLSRQALEEFVRGIKRQREEVDDPYLESRDYGAFVSLHKKREREVASAVVRKGSVFETVTEMTEAAASVIPGSDGLKNSAKSNRYYVLSPLSPWKTLTLEIGKHVFVLGETRCSSS